MSLTPKNWSLFQHYRDRRPPWIKLHKSLLDDIDYLCLPDASKALAPFLWLLASEYEDGEIDLSLAKMAMRLRMSEEKLAEGLKPLIKDGFFSDSSALAGVEQNARLDREEKETEKEKDVLPLQPSASALSPSGEEKKKERKPRKVQTTALKDGSVKSFEAAWETVPKTFRKWDAQLREYVDEPIPKGSRLEAERNFQAIVDSRVATPQELYYAFYAYITEGEGPAKGFYQALSTFCGPRKATYLQWIARGQELALEAQ